MTGQAYIYFDAQRDINLKPTFAQGFPVSNAMYLTNGRPGPKQSFQDRATDVLSGLCQPTNALALQQQNMLSQHETIVPVTSGNQGERYQSPPTNICQDTAFASLQPDPT